MNTTKAQDETLRMWFVSQEGRSHGPLSTSDVEEQLALSPTTQIWWKGMDHWVGGHEWLSMRKNAMKSSPGIYYFDHERHIPRTLNEALNLITPSKSLINKIKLWSPLDNRSKSIFEIKPLCEALGLKMRKYVRTPLSGTAIINKGNLSITAELQSVSAEGMGIRFRNEIELPKGEVSVTFKNTDIMELPSVTAKLLYTSRGVAGFKFEKITPESSHRIISHIRLREGAALVTAA